MRLRFPAPGDPFGPAEGFSDDAVRLATLVYKYLELAEIIWNSAARHHLHMETIRLRGVNRNPRYMHRWREYRDSCEPYVIQNAGLPPPPPDRN